MRKKVECLNRLFDTLKCRSDILDYLKEEKLISDDVAQGILHDNHTQHASKIASILEELARADKLQLVDYEWTILPKELVKLTLVSRNNKKEFAYSV